MVGVGRVEDVLFVDVQQGQRPHVDPGIVVGELQTREHALDEHGFAGAGFAQDADDVVERRQMLLGDLRTQFEHAHRTARCEIYAI